MKFGRVFALFVLLLYSFSSKAYFSYDDFKCLNSERVKIELTQFGVTVLYCEKSDKTVDGMYLAFYNQPLDEFEIDQYEKDLLFYDKKTRKYHALATLGQFKDGKKSGIWREQSREVKLEIDYSSTTPKVNLLNDDEIDTSDNEDAYLFEIDEDFNFPQDETTTHLFEAVSGAVGFINYSSTDFSHDMDLYVESRNQAIDQMIRAVFSREYSGASWLVFGLVGLLVRGLNHEYGHYFEAERYNLDPDVHIPWLEGESSYRMWVSVNRMPDDHDVLMRLALSGMARSRRSFHVLHEVQGEHERLSRATSVMAIYFLSDFPFYALMHYMRTQNGANMMMDDIQIYMDAQNVPAKDIYAFAALDVLLHLREWRYYILGLLGIQSEYPKPWKVGKFFWEPQVVTDPESGIGAGIRVWRNF